MTKRMYETSIVSEQLKKLRKEKNVTQCDVAKETNISLASIKQYETGKRVPEKYNLDLLASYYKVDPNYILGISKYKNAFHKIDTELGDENLKELAWKIETIKRFSSYFDMDLSQLNDNQIEKMNKKIKGFIKVLINSLNDKKEENKMKTPTEREWVIMGITEALEDCQDMELLYLIRSLLFENDN